MAKKKNSKVKLSRPSLQNRFDYLMKSVLTEIEQHELKKVNSPKAQQAEHLVLENSNLLP